MWKWLTGRGAKALVPRTAAGSDHPATVLAAAHPHPVAPERRFFDPALKHFTHALRLPDPEGLAPAQSAEWSQARRDAMDHLLRVIAASPARDSLVLRGSVALRLWFGDQAREPHDIDWVVRPARAPSAGQRVESTSRGLPAGSAAWPQGGTSQTVSADDQWVEAFFRDLLTVLAVWPQGGTALLVPQEAACDGIWTYERANGKRLAMPWRTAGGLVGSVQMDVVVGEDLPEEPTRVAIPLGDGGAAELLAASRATSLAWKLLWLGSDRYPQGKDLYDAVLLAESCLLPRALLATVLEQAKAKPISAASPLGWDIDWEPFRKEYPGILGDRRVWQKRLAEALARMPEWA